MLEQQPTDDLFDDDYGLIENQLEKQRKQKEKMKQTKTAKPDFVQSILNARAKGKFLFQLFYLD